MPVIGFEAHSANKFRPEIPYLRFLHDRKTHCAVKNNQNSPKKPAKQSDWGSFRNWRLSRINNKYLRCHHRDNSDKPGIPGTGKLQNAINQKWGEIGVRCTPCWAALVCPRNYSDRLFFLLHISCSATIIMVATVSGITKYSMTALNLGKASCCDAAKTRYSV